ncbi:MAG: hypothetical protein WCS65_09250 [Verrucomicrobiae bacterium]
MSAPSPLPHSKQAILSLWSAQVAQSQRILSSGLVGHEAGKVAILLLGSLRREIEDMIDATDEAWTRPGQECGSIAEVIASDFRRVTLLLSSGGRP